MPNAVLARAIGELTAEQLRLFIGLAYAAEWRPGGSVSADGRWRIGRGQVLVSYDGLAARYGMEWQAVRRALRRFEQVGLATARRASLVGVSGDTRADTQADSAPDTSGGTPPTLVDLGSWFGIQAPSGPTDTPADTQADTRANMSADPIQQENKGTQNTKTSSPSPSAPASAPRRRRRAGAEPDPRHRPLQERLEAAFREVRGSAYGFQPRDAKALTELLRLSNGDSAEVERRWRTGLDEAGFRRCDGMHELAAKWNAYSGANGAPRRPVPAEEQPAGPREQPERRLAAAAREAEGWALLEERIDAAGKLTPMLQTTLGGCELRTEGQLLTARPRRPDVAAALEFYRAGLEREAHCLGLGLQILEPARAAAMGGAP
ncbi:hypothetical protein [Anaeromyxobacter dehalogenans]|uniref:hypothetical protein n=1 Tax=Anaeromyxobacter dehalogenans TaxID=161493 RepID=UPI00123732C6|nr:hypothetical protein [Anaeromyxobacter dehalogenans]